MCLYKNEKKKKVEQTIYYFFSFHELNGKKNCAENWLEAIFTPVYRLCVTRAIFPFFFSIPTVYATKRSEMKIIQCLNLFKFHVTHHLSTMYENALLFAVRFFLFFLSGDAVYCEWQKNCN